MSNDSEKPFSARPEWADVTPVSQDDGPSPLVPIAYSSAYSDAMSYFRAILQTNEYSPRVLDLTAHIIRLNPSHYSVWKYRQDAVIARDADLLKELEFVEEMAEDQPKSYQTWHYRQAIIRKLGDASREVEFINRMLHIDSKNYHAWSYRQWVISTFDLWDGEMADTNRFLDMDVRNNSAWNQRYWVLKNRPSGFTDEDIAAEVKYALEMIYLAPRNESPWAYLRGIVALGGKTLDDFPSVEETCKDLSDKGQSIPHALAMLLDMKVAVKDVDECRRICAILEENDPIRQKYWKYRAESVK
ncbi:uncharacterized protein SPPG_03810 [Spizellomyces punctatus DAOM BR117]|uniref:Protein farnesyltransferase/geranylgeranyltransferase type-1 subunit alpha n=1 Tax=Spizellomyces punctatus (strain DAOM BR117) TaxID=645134 RepID=A0A0L0HHX3_SPIPD|nr:uncharacterized protein SPPG_03810 [Spizellomyces punctatus DAOM BR117]KND00688.1 hypothetical protein SPPG_03810 [Spizellomyces punctatus DAOM BR117]|eukprot:XP_016608727.1 hypothetical protein SPPG_03810 [Spizellomyces punctatus DAOM BR117]